MSAALEGRVTSKDIQMVQNLIERCLQLYMNRGEVMKTLSERARIEPRFTELVWLKLEEENQEFFQAYHLRLMVKTQINEFNKLLEQQHQLIRQINQTGVASMPSSNGSHFPQFTQNMPCYVPEHQQSSLKPESIHHNRFGGSSLPNAFTNGEPSFHSTMHTAVDMSAHASRIDTPPNMLSSLSSNMGLMQGNNGGVIKSETEYAGASPFTFGADVHVPESFPPITDASLSSVESNSQALNEHLLDADTSSFGYLGQISENFLFMDLTADFDQSSDILDNYSGSSLLETGNGSLLGLHDQEHEGDTKRLGITSEGMNYDEFRSE